MVESTALNHPLETACQLVLSECCGRKCPNCDFMLESEGFCLNTFLTNDFMVSIGTMSNGCVSFDLALNPNQELYRLGDNRGCNLSKSAFTEFIKVKQSNRVKLR